MWFYSLWLIGPGSAQLSFTRNGMDVLKKKKVTVFKEFT